MTTYAIPERFVHPMNDLLKFALNKDDDTIINIDYLRQGEAYSVITGNYPSSFEESIFNNRVDANKGDAHDALAAFNNGEVMCSTEKSMEEAIASWGITRGVAESNPPVDSSGNLIGTGGELTPDSHVKDDAIYATDTGNYQN